ncbi:MAG TPA: cyclic nucleotide-binding domain-containing protein [Anaerolineae bacterium]|nr:cyclic nucleotide-binding domain-containing protein [Anaerolineae bacterium]
MDVISRLQGIYFFDKLTPDEFQALASICKLQRYISGEDILMQGELTTRFFIVDEGYVNLRHTDFGGFERPIGSKAPGEYFGIKMFTTQEPSEFTFEAVGAASMWVIERNAWDALLEQRRDILANMPELREEYARLTRGLDWLSPGEVIDLVTRRHWWALFLMIRLPLLVAIIFSLAFFIPNRLGVTDRLTWLLPVYGIVLVVCLLWAIWEALNWWNDTYIITNKRVVRLNRVLFISDSRDEIPIPKIQSQKVDRGGPISVLLNISNLRITSAASDTPGLVFEQVGDVQRIQQAIDAEKMRVIERNRAKEREKLRNQISTEIRHYVFQTETEPQATEATTALGTPALASTRAKGGAPAYSSIRRRFWRRTPTQVQVVPFSARFLSFWNALIGTEIRQGHTVTWRKHHVVLLEQIGFPLVAFLALVLFAVFITVSGVPFDLAPNGLYAVLFVLMLIALAFIAWEWQDWRLDLYRLTDKEIVDIESLPFGLRYDEKRAELRNIQDVNTARPHFINTLLDYGNVEARVAGNAAPFTFTSVSHPRTVADEIQERIEMLKLRAAERATREQSQSVVDAIVAYHRLLTQDRFQTLTQPRPAPIEPTPAPPPIMPNPPIVTQPDGDETEFPPESEL